MPIPIPPQIDPAPVRTPIDVREKKILVKDNTSWEKFFELLYAAVLYLLNGPRLMSGDFADLPDPTMIPEDSRYWAKDTTQEYIVEFVVPGDHTSAVWTAM